MSGNDWDYVIARQMALREASHKDIVTPGVVEQMTREHMTYSKQRTNYSPQDNSPEQNYSVTK